FFVCNKIGIVIPDRTPPILYFIFMSGLPIVSKVSYIIIGTGPNQEIIDITILPVTCANILRSIKMRHLDTSVKLKLVDFKPSGYTVIEFIGGEIWILSFVINMV